MPADDSHVSNSRNEPQSFHSTSDHPRVLELEHRLGCIRKVLHRMNNDLTAVSLSVESLTIPGSSRDETAPDRFELVKSLLAQLTADFRNLTLLSRGGSVD